MDGSGNAGRWRVDLQLFLGVCSRLRLKGFESVLLLLRLLRRSDARGLDGEDRRLVRHVLVQGCRRECGGFYTRRFIC